MRRCVCLFALLLPACGSPDTAAPPSGAAPPAAASGRLHGAAPAAAGLDRYGEELEQLMGRHFEELNLWLAGKWPAALGARPATVAALGERHHREAMDLGRRFGSKGTPAYPVPWYFGDVPKRSPIKLP